MQKFLVESADKISAQTSLEHLACIRISCSPPVAILLLPSCYYEWINNFPTLPLRAMARARRYFPLFLLLAALCRLGTTWVEGSYSRWSQRLRGTLLPGCSSTDSWFPDLEVLTSVNDVISEDHSNPLAMAFG